MKTHKKLICAFLLAEAILPSLTNAQQWQAQPVQISTRWAKQLNPILPLNEYPRPQLVRNGWTNLNGLWEYAITAKEQTSPDKFDGKILVPFPVESSLSGVKKSLKPEEALWYKRAITKPIIKSGERILLNFGAVDFEATVFLNGKQVGKHTGGYQAFSIDLTNDLKTGSNELAVKVWDPSDQGPNPHGKQVLNPQGIMYTPSSGIWQTVWLETVPTEHISSLKITTDVDKSQVVVEVNSASPSDVTIQAAGKTIKGKTNSRITLPIKNAKLWSPDNPYLYDLIVTLGKDKIQSYFGMRKVEVKQDGEGFDRIYLNGKYTYNLGTLDQGFWPDGLYTAPSDEALKFDVQASKAMGFNTIRKHIKVEPARWYYWADKLGMLVWQDMVNPGNDNADGKAQFEKESAENIRQLYNYPSIVAWVLFNEKWGQYDQERLTTWMKQADPTRLVNGHSGEKLYVNDALRSPSPDAWIGADMTDVHAYPNPGHIAFEKGKASVLGEFGGIGVPVEGHLWDDLTAGWGYDGVVTPTVLRKQYTGMVDSLKKLETQGLTASIYTQPFDVETEQNGLMTYDREIVKLPLDVLRSIHARIWPATKNWEMATRGLITKVADTVNRDLVDRLKEYSKGKRDSAFLRSSALIALKHNDQLNAGIFSAEYIRLLKSPKSDNNIHFIEKFTAKKSEPGFKILMEWVKQYLSFGERNGITGRLQDIIFREDVRPYLGVSPQWNKIEEIIDTIKPVDGEMIRGLSVIYYLNQIGAGQENSPKNLLYAATKYDDLYNSGAYNDWAWALFKHTNDRTALEKAAQWAKKGVEKEADSGRKASLIDTYANLLHKLGRTEEALQWQEKAVTASPGDIEIKEAYEKMKRGEKTWDK